MGKADREMLRNKFGGCCAYCGTALPDRWHADHFEPVRRELHSVTIPGTRTYRLVSGKPTRPELDTIENMMPACPPCNINKHSMGIEAWRQAIANSINVLNTNNSTYRFAKAFGLLVETAEPVRFYFETFEAGLPTTQP